MRQGKKQKWILQSPPPLNGYLSKIRFWAQENYWWKKVWPAYCHFKSMHFHIFDIEENDFFMWHTVLIRTTYRAKLIYLCEWSSSEICTTLRMAHTIFNLRISKRWYFVYVVCLYFHLTNQFTNFNYTSTKNAGWILFRLIKLGSHLELIILVKWWIWGGRG